MPGAPHRPSYDYDLVVVGAGAAGLFAAGTAAGVGYRTLLLEKRSPGSGAGGEEGGTDADDPPVHVGGDCTNAACVPSKAVRSVGRLRMAAEAAAAAVAEAEAEAPSPSPPRAGGGAGRWLHLARAHSVAAVRAVRDREEPAARPEEESPNPNPNPPLLEVEYVRDCRFVSAHEMRLEGGAAPAAATATAVDRVVSARRFLIATGAAPLLPEALAWAADRARVPHSTYRTVLGPSTHPGGDGRDGGVWDLLNGTTHAGGREDPGPPRIAVVGGGATACELGQSLSRLGGEEVEVSIVAPMLMPTEDDSLQKAAAAMLTRDGCRLRRAKVLDVLGEGEGKDEGKGESKGKGKAKGRLLLDDGETLPVDHIIFCLGRTPEPSLASLDLNRAGVAWTGKEGLTVNSYLRSLTSRNVYAAGDCASAIHPRDRRAIHAGWTGFHAVRNALLPWFLRSPAVHPCVPRVVYTDPEMASAGLSTIECTELYGPGGYDSLRVDEEGTDRADMERVERSTDDNFIELRSAKISGRILGATACGPAAAELINEVCLAIVNKMTVRDMARTLHSYPSHGYLLYRTSMALATQSLSGLLAGCGPIGRCLGAMIRSLQRLLLLLRYPLGRPKSANDLSKES